MKNLYLIGIMGCGKTTLGKMLAAKLGCAFCDLDDEIELQEQKTISQIFAQSGEETYRTIETEVLRNVARRTQCIVSCGGGIVLRSENKKIMQESGRIVWIKRPVAEIARSVDTAKRPLLKNGADALYDIYHKREALYEDFAQEILENTTTAAAGLESLENLLTKRLK